MAPPKGYEPGPTGIHHSLRHVDPGPGDVGAPTHVGHTFQGGDGNDLTLTVVP